MRAKPAYESLPAPPGRSPFHIKGQAYAGHMTYVGEHLPGGVPAFLDGFVDPELRAFFEQPFLASSWYDVFPLVAAGSVCAKISGVTLRDFLRARSRWQAERDTQGVYKLLLNVVSAEALAMRMPRLIKQYFDFGTMEVHRVRERMVAGDLRGLPAFMAVWYTVVQETYIDYVLTVAGAKSPLVRSERPEPDGSRDGIALVRLRADVTWEA